MSEVRPLVKASPKRHISSTRLRATTNHLKFFHGSDDSLTGVEFETHPLTKVLNVIFDALDQRRVCIADCATRITQSSLYQRLSLTEVGGAPLLGERRFDVEGLFVEALATALAPPEMEEECRAAG